MRKLEARNPQFREYTGSKIAKNKFIKWLGFEITRVEPGYTEGEMLFKEMHEQQDGWLHGGITSTLLDMVQGFASYSMVEAEQRVLTIEAKISYFNPGRSHKFYARGWVAKPGKRFHFCEGELYFLDEEGKEIIVAKGSTTMAVIEKQ